MKSKQTNVRWIKTYQRSGSKFFAISFMFRGFNIRRRGYLSADEALLEGTRIRTLIIQGKYNPDMQAEKVSKMSLDTYFETIFLPAKSNTLKTSSLRTYKQCFKNWIQPVVGKVNIQQIASKHAQRIIDNMDTNEKSTDTKKTVMNVFKNMVNHSVSAGYREAGINIPTISGKAKTKRVLSPLEVAKLINSAQELYDEEFSRLIKTLYLTGLRIGEAVALRRGDINLERGSITIARRYYENVTEGNWDTPKNGKIQTIPIHPELLQVLHEQLAEGHNKSSQLLFSNEAGKVLKPSSIRGKLYKVAAKALGNADQVSPHALRRSIASTLVDNNIPLDSVADYMRHGTKVLENHYNQPNRKQFRENFKSLQLVANDED